jgi:DNA mismatch repair ATPase MutS
MEVAVSDADAFGPEEDITQLCAPTERRPTAALASAALRKTFLKPDLWLKSIRRDLQRRFPTDKDFDSRTVYIGETFFQRMPALQAEYWRNKQHHLDCVVLLGVGKSFRVSGKESNETTNSTERPKLPEETDCCSRRDLITSAMTDPALLCFFPSLLFQMCHEDADIGMTRLGLHKKKSSALGAYTSFSGRELKHYTTKLLKAKLKVVVVEELRGEMSDGELVERRITRIETPGTFTDPDLCDSSECIRLLALTEAITNTSKTKEPQKVQIAFAFKDPQTGEIVYGSFCDTADRSELTQLLQYVDPSEILVPRGVLSATTNLVLQGEPALRTERNATEFWNLAKTIEEIENRGYFKPKHSNRTPTVDPMDYWPQSLATAAKDKQELVFSALGGMICYLQDLKKDEYILRLRNILSWEDKLDRGKYLELDSATIRNLEVVKNKSGTIAGTIFEFLHFTATGFGRRKLREWVLKPLFSPELINERQDAVELLRNESVPELYSPNSLSQLCDLPTLLCRIRYENPANSTDGVFRATKVKILQVHTATSQQRLSFEFILSVALRTLFVCVCLLQLWKDFTKVEELVRRCAPSLDALKDGCRIKKLLNYKSDGGLLPDDFPKILSDLNHAVEFDERGGRILPADNEECNEAMLEVERCSTKLEECRQELMQLNPRKKKIELVRDGNHPYLFAIMGQHTSPSHGWEVVAQTEEKSLYKPLLDKTFEQIFLSAEQTVARFEKSTVSLVLVELESKCSTLTDVIGCIAELDCLLALAEASRKHPGYTRPVFVSESKNPMLELRGAMHPLLYDGITLPNHMGSAGSDKYVANDTVIGCEENPATFVFLTGPNMGGASRKKPVHNETVG